MVLFGDSHAAHWFPAMKKVAESHEWRLLNLTKSACPSVDVPLTQDGEPYTACEKWRRNSIKRIQAERPRFVLLTNGRRSGIPPREWAEGLYRVLEQLKGTTRVVLSDSPRPEVDVPACLSQHRNNPGRCKTPRDKALFRWHTELEKRAARDAGAPFIRSTRWICPDKRCAVIAWRRLMYRDDHHLTATFSRFLSTQLDAALIDKGLLPNSAPDP
jgi:hypothetical protein